MLVNISTFASRTYRIIEYRYGTTLIRTVASDGQQWFLGMCRANRTDRCRVQKLEFRVKIQSHDEAEKRIF